MGFWQKQYKSDNWGKNNYAWNLGRLGVVFYIGVC